MKPVKKNPLPDLSSWHEVPEGAIIPGRTLVAFVDPTSQRPILYSWNISYQVQPDEEFTRYTEHQLFPEPGWDCPIHGVVGDDGTGFCTCPHEEAVDRWSTTCP